MSIRSTDGLLEIAFKTEGATALHLAGGSFPEISLDEMRVPLQASHLDFLTDGQVVTDADVREHAETITAWLQMHSQLEAALSAGRQFSTSFYSPICGKQLNITVIPDGDKVAVEYQVAA